MSYKRPRDGVIRLDPALNPSPDAWEFIKTGEFSRNHVIWRTPRLGIVVTDCRGYTFNGEKTSVPLSRIPGGGTRPEHI